MAGEGLALDWSMVLISLCRVGPTLQSLINRRERGRGGGERNGPKAMMSSPFV